MNRIQIHEYENLNHLHPPKLNLENGKWNSENGFEFEKPTQNRNLLTPKQTECWIKSKQLKSKQT